MVNRNSKEFKGLISIVEVSAISNVNVESAFLLLASLIGKWGGGATPPCFLADLIRSQLTVDVQLYKTSAL